MSIHHATAKSAAAKGVTLEETPAGVVAFWPARNQTITAPDAKAALAAMVTRQSELWAEEIEEHGFDDEEADEQFPAFLRGEIPAPGGDVDEGDVDEGDVDGEAGDVEDAGRSVVPEKYRELYRQRGNPRHCGDELALILAELTLVNPNAKSSEVDVAALDALAIANDVDISKYRRFGVGWQGRLRMTFRVLLGNLLKADYRAKGTALLCVPGNEPIDMSGWAAGQPQPKGRTKRKATPAEIAAFVLETAQKEYDKWGHWLVETTTEAELTAAIEADPSLQRKDWALSHYREVGKIQNEREAVGG